MRQGLAHAELAERSGGPDHGHALTVLAQVEGLHRCALRSGLRVVDDSGGDAVDLLIAHPQPAQPRPDLLLGLLVVTLLRGRERHRWRHAALAHGFADGLEVTAVAPLFVQGAFQALGLAPLGQGLGPALIQIVVRLCVGPQRLDRSLILRDFPLVLAVSVRQLGVAQRAVVLQRFVVQGTRVSGMNRIAEGTSHGIARALAGIDVTGQRRLHIVLVDLGNARVHLLPHLIDFLSPLEVAVVALGLLLEGSAGLVEPALQARTLGRVLGFAQVLPEAIDLAQQAAFSG